MSDLFEQMVAAYQPVDGKSRRNAEYEVMQQIVLGGLQRGGFFQKAAFYGGTCLRIFHGLRRFSEDMDFTLLEKNPDFRLEDYFQAIIDECLLVGRTVTIVKKEKRNFGKVESAFLKDNTDVYDLSFQTEKSLKIKIEVDTLPPLGFSTEQKMLDRPRAFMTRCVTLPDLYAGKLHALTFRVWKNRVKGRDWYDFLWYVANNVPLDFDHLQKRIAEFNGVTLSRDAFLHLLRERLTTTDMNLVKADVLPYVVDPYEIEAWSNDIFLQAADRIRFL